MNGGPVGQFDGEYVNGHSTNGTNSPSTPGFHDSHKRYPDDRRDNHPRKKLFSTDPEPEEEAYPSSYAPRADTWPQSPPPATLKTKANGTNGQHAGNKVPPPGPHEGGVGGPRSRAYVRAKPAPDDDANARSQYPRISRPVELLRGSYDCVVIGSGYGGAVAASRAARAGEEVCVLELGKERWPGEYPADVESAMKDLHVSGNITAGGVLAGMLRGINVDEGDPTGMYHLIFGKGQNAVVCNGESSLSRVLRGCPVFGVN